MPQPKADEWEDVDSQWEDIDFEDVPAAKPPSSFLKSVYDSTFTAPKFITDITGEVPEGGITDAFKAIPDVASGLWNHPFETISGGLKGAVQGAGAQLSPANVISTAVPYVKPIKAAAPFVNAVLGAGQVTKGASEILEGDVSTGLGNIGFGALGVGTAGKFPSRKGNLSKIATAADDIPPGEYKPTPDFKDNANSKRYYELVEKSRNGTLTGNELIEARKLDKIVREEQYTPEPIKDLPETVVIKKPTSGYLKRLKEQGYEPAGTSKDGFPQMKLKKADDWEDILSTMEEEVPAAKSIEVVDDDIISTVGSPADDALSPTNNPEWDAQTLNELRNELKMTNIDLSKFKNADDIQAHIDSRDAKAGAKTLGDHVEEAELAIKNQPIDIANEMKIVPRTPRQIMDSLAPEYNDPELNSLIKEFRKMEGIRKMRDTKGYSEEEFTKMGNTVEAIRNHPSFPESVKAEWTEAGRIAKERGPKFNIGDKVRIKDTPPSSKEAGLKVIPRKEYPGYKGQLKQRVIEGEVLPAEVGKDIFGKPTNRDLTPQEVAEIKAKMEGDLRATYGEDISEADVVMDKINGIIDVPNSGRTVIDEVMKAGDEGFVTINPRSPQIREMRQQGYTLAGKLSDGTLVLDYPEGNSARRGVPYKGLTPELPPMTPEIKRIVDTYQLDPDEVVDLLGGPISKETVGAPPSKYKSPKPVPPPNPQVKRVINKTPEQIKQTVPQDELPKIMRSLDDEIEFARTQPPEVQKTLYRKIMDTQKAVLTGYDTSFIGRQGRGLITHKGYWNAFADLRAALGSDEAAKLASQAIIDHPSGYFKSTIDPDTGKTIAPFAERMGLKLSDVYNTENMSSNWAETGGNIPYFSRAYRESAGRLFKATQRGNLAFINKAKADVFVSLMGQLKRRGINPLLDEVTSRQVAKSINSSTGKGSFGKWENPTLNLETKQLEASTTMRVLNEVFLSPQFMKSRFDMYNRILNPVTGAFAPWSNMDRTVRIEAVRSLAGIVGSALLIQELARMAGAKIIDDPTNPDYRKVIVGNTRMDNMAGIQQYGVGMTQFFTGQTTSSTSGRTSELVGGFGNRAPSYGAKNTADVVGNFLVNRFALIPSMLMAWMRGTDFDNKPFEFKRALANRISPLVAQDIMELVKEDPELFPFAIAPVVGEGLQTYGR